MDKATDPSRPRGILNERERHYLLGEAEIESRSQTERDIRATIRTRVRHALFDFALLFDHMEARDLAQVFDPRADDAAPLRTAIEDTLGFFYRATIDFHPPFQYLAKEGIQRAEHQHFDRHVRASIDVEATAPIDPAVIREKMSGERTDQLTPEEARWIAETVLASGDVTFDTLEQAHEQVREQRAGRQPPDGEDTSDGGGD
ncbi:phage regulatory CII family protein [Halorussus salilacus]|uniref:phage regulatory CII family protein n=1 Tax=Halorussus salilacus TaxID=2953750 RepID=UPI0020A06789|nr:phage regulatory CII family protein [Halorussus salilacus]USZ68539.1 phage regulatory CII family protein [Halorussus salilacus]